MNLQEMVLRLVLLVPLLLLSIFYTLSALGFSTLARYAPLFAGTLAVLLLSVAVIREVLRIRTTLASNGPARDYGRTLEHMGQDELTVSRAVLRKAAVYIAWLLFLVVSIRLVGFLAGSAIFLGLFLHFDTKLSFRATAISIVSVTIFLLVLREAIGFSLPDGWLFSL